MTFKDIIKEFECKLICGDINIEIKNLCKDTRSIKEGDIYIGIKGDNFDGNIFYKEAFSKGAIACILDNEDIIDEKNNTIILVNNTIEFISKLATYKRSLYNIPVIGITGSVGKTSVKDMIKNVLSKKYNVLATKGNYNNEIGVPLTILELDKHDALIVEMGMNHEGELSKLSKIAKPTISVITNIGTAHIGNLGSRVNILKAKLEILDGMNNGLLIINNDNDMLHTVKYDNLITIGINNKSNYMATNINSYAFYSKFKINNQNIKIPIGGEAFIYNALLAYAVGKELNINDNLIIEALNNIVLTPHRLEVITKDKYTIIDDTYNASLDSVKNALENLSKVNSRKVFIFADILELDNYAIDIHKEISHIIMNKNIDLLITIGNLSKYTHLECSNIEKYHYPNNSELLKEINNIIKENDTILIKGSHSMNLIEIVNYLKNNTN